MIPAAQQEKSLAASAELAENSRLGFERKNAALNTGSTFSKSRTALGLRAVLAETCVRENSLTNWNGMAISYDLNGNMLSDGSNAFTWNARNQVAALNTVSLQYDGFGRRTKNTAGKSFLFDGANAAQELSGSTVLANLLNGGVDEIFTRVDSAGSFTPLKDALGSTIALVDSSGNVVTTYAYDPFGNTTVSGAGNANVAQYTGRENEGNGLYFYRARYYNSLLGRFINEDPLGFGGGDVNSYAYVLDSPANYIDPSGLNVTVKQYKGAGGNPGGHIGIAVNSDKTDGFYPQQDSDALIQIFLAGPPNWGKVSADDPAGTRIVEDSIVIYTTPQQDAAIQAYIDQMKKSNWNYYYTWNTKLFGRNCAGFVEDALAAGHITSLDTMWPRKLMRNLHEQFDSRPYKFLSPNGGPGGIPPDWAQRLGSMR